MQKSKASIVFSDYLARLLLDNISNNKYDNDLWNKCKIIYHGAEPNLRYAITKGEARSVFSLPTDKNIKIVLATGFATNTKGWDILKRMHIPKNWIIVTNHSRNHYSKEIPVLSHPSSYRIIMSDINSSKSNHDTRLVELNRGFLTDEELSILFYASDAVILSYTVTSGSGVMFDALSHGLPFIASDLGFFKEFANKGLGIVVNRKSEEFSNAIEVLEKNYLQYVERVNHFSRAHLNWDSVAKQHVELYLDVISNADYGQNYSNDYMPTRKQNDIENSLSSSWKKYSLLLPLNYLTNKFINLP